MIDKKNRSQAVIGREQFVDIELSATEILALFGTSKTLVPGPLTTEHLVFTGAVIHKPANATA